MNTMLYLSAILAAITNNESNTEKPYHEQLLAYLQVSDAVVPNALPDVHPFRTAFNPEAIIPPQCYTQTAGTHNPCYVCHQNKQPQRENTMQDGELQLAYSFSDVGMTNHWKNLFEDRSAQVDAISDAEILAWVNSENYSGLAEKLQQADFQGWIPDLQNLHLGADAFDTFGFAKDGSHWVAFNYKPLPSTFWPTNGATDDVMIRLPTAFRTLENGEYSVDVYRANLALVEANVKMLDEISSLPVDERIVKSDLDQNGTLNITQQIRDTSSYVGAAKKAYKEASLYPNGTQFLHTVRYLGFDEDHRIVPSRRIKEIRYMRKWKTYSRLVYARHYELEGFEKEIGNLPGYAYLGDHGLDNGFGWSLQGFIENRKGELRVATYEENLFCMGCHTSIGSTIDKTFSFPRKVDGAEGWGYINLVGMPDAPNQGELEGEIATYLKRVGGGGEFRSNPEMWQRWFNEAGQLDEEAVASATDVYTLITPSRERAMLLNKAYKTIVDTQDYLYGRDATWIPPNNVYEHIDNNTAPTLPDTLFHEWDIRLDWSAVDSTASGATHHRAR